MNSNNIYLYLLLLISFTACQESYYYSQSHEIDAEGWTAEDIVEFPFVIQDTTEHYNLFLDIKHQQAYPFQNLYIKIDTKYPNKEIKSDTLSFDLANKSGDWNGECGGESCKLRVFLAHHIRFGQLGNYKISIAPFSREDKVKYINNIALRLAPLEK